MRAIRGCRGQRNRVRSLLGSRARAAASAMRALRASAVATHLQLVRPAPAVRARRALGLLDSRRHRRRDRARAQVQWLVGSGSEHGGAHGATVVAGGCRGGAIDGRADAARAHARTRARLQSERAARARPRDTMADSIRLRLRGARAHNGDANTVDTRGETGQRFGRVSCDSEWPGRSSKALTSCSWMTSLPPAQRFPNARPRSSRAARESSVS